VDEIIEDIACSLCVPRHCLNIIAGSKGLVAGNLLIVMKDGTEIQCGQSGDQGLLIPNVEDIDLLITSASFVLVVEKESSFGELLTQGFLDWFKDQGILVTGKGYPDVSTRSLLKKMSTLERKEEVYNSMDDSFEYITMPPLRILALVDGKLCSALDGAFD
jgi:meiotic recombination protein SPO11